MNFPQALSLAALIAAGLILWTLRQWLLLLFAAVVVGLALCSLVDALQRRFPMRRPLALLVCVSALGLVLTALAAVLVHRSLMNSPCCCKNFPRQPERCCSLP